MKRKHLGNSEIDTYVDGLIKAKHILEKILFLSQSSINLEKKVPVNLNIGSFLF